ncbi:hypothetical protein PIB30_036322 [Stylosanthes scabra]|uniref:Uncharacterized protein n=1 Tax=Stylosanthes scabra TaxID=79078 RepID=A0ABU6UCS6_9FABA|nr:hypothetical protein [Stylosanthes scabra]
MTSFQRYWKANIQSFATIYNSPICVRIQIRSGAHGTFRRLCHSGSSSIVRALPRQHGISAWEAGDRRGLGDSRIVPVIAGYSWEPGAESRTPSNTCSKCELNPKLWNDPSSILGILVAPCDTSFKTSRHRLQGERCFQTTTTKASPPERAPHTDTPSTRGKYKRSRPNSLQSPSVAETSVGSGVHNNDGILESVPVNLHVGVALVKVNPISSNVERDDAGNSAANGLLLVGEQGAPAKSGGTNFLQPHPIISHVTPVASNAIGMKNDDDGIASAKGCLLVGAHSANVKVQDLGSTGMVQNC